MASEAGHEPNRAYFDQAGNIHLNGASLFDSAETDQKAVVAGVGAGYKMARGVAALDGSNPTPVTTGLTTIVAAVATLQKTSTLGSGTAFVTVDFTGADGTLNLYGWVAAGTASTGTESVNWVAFGT